MPRAKPSQATDEDTIVDEPQESGTLAGPVADGIPEPVAEALAKRMGWKPKEEWTRDPEAWAPATQFLEKTLDQVEDLRTRNRELREEKERAARATAEMIEEDRRRVREEALRTIRTADDPEERAAAANKLAENSGPPPETQAWLGKNPWFYTVPDARAIVTSTVNDLARQGVSIPAQLEAAEKKVRKLFPEYFSTGTEQRLSDVRRQAPNPPQVQQGSRAATSGAPKEKGFAEIPSQDRQLFRTLQLKHFMAAGQTQEQAEARYARGYWASGVTDPSERGDEQYPMKPQSNVWAKRRGTTRV